ncbi:hypothetical protein SESBI_32454 [Sesbania bispinosa]|nr:hypothetical protein SESBI_32454 [Sesbania bispinosa]
MATKSCVATLLVVVCLVMAVAVTEADKAADQKCYDECYNGCGWPAFLCDWACYEKCFLHRPDRKIPGRKQKGGVGPDHATLPATPSMDQPNPKKLN